MWGLLAFQMRFGVIMTGVGVISLAGIVVNNAIVLIDCALQRKAAGLGRTWAWSCWVRFSPRSWAWRSSAACS
jgi:multidrug efflux pump subunit AcrB